MDLFESASQKSMQSRSPLADRMRPRILDEYIGQRAILGEGRLLRRAIEADRLSSLIFYGPPGVGKTTLAKIIANTTKSHFITINAVLAGKEDIRNAIAEAHNTFNLHSRRTILFVDEVHRFNKAQQDALLPNVESGVLILIGATTENPYFEVNKALVSRSRIFQLKPLDSEDLREILFQALKDNFRGFGNKKVEIDENAVEHLCNSANGDARSVLNALELAVETTPPDQTGTIKITREIAEESIQQRAVLYDKDGDAHYDIISAFIKSVRGSDPDAALFWLAKMIYAGEDPRFIFRRMIMLASEDIGLADPNAVSVVMSCAKAYDYIGMPEGRFPLSQACLYLATAPKSNSALALFDAIKSVQTEDKADDIPNPLRDSSRDREGFGHGEGYLYPHAYRDHWVNQQYLPNNLRGKVFYTPSNQGYEAKIADEVQKRREIQIASYSIARENSTFLYNDGNWFERTFSQTDNYAESIRSTIFEIADVKPSDLVLDINCGAGGFLSLEAARLSHESGVWAYALSKEDAENLQNYTDKLSYFTKPNVIWGKIDEIGNKISAKFDCIIGRNVLSLFDVDYYAKFVENLKKLLEKDGRIIFCQYLPKESSLLSDFLENYPVCFAATPSLSKGESCGLWEKAKIAENETLEKTMLGKFSPEEFSQIFKENGFSVKFINKNFSIKRKITADLFENWFRNDENSFGNILKKHTNEKEFEKIKENLRFALTAGETEWKQANCFFEIRRAI
jgi:putative ATPase